MQNYGVHKRSRPRATPLAPEEFGFDLDIEVIDKSVPEMFHETIKKGVLVWNEPWLFSCTETQRDGELRPDTDPDQKEHPVGEDHSTNNVVSPLDS